MDSEGAVATAVRLFGSEDLEERRAFLFAVTLFSSVQDADRAYDNFLEELDTGRAAADILEDDGIALTFVAEAVPEVGDARAARIGMSEDDGEAVTLTYLIVRDGLFVHAWFHTGVGESALVALSEAALGRIGAQATPIPIASNEASLLSLLPAVEDLPDGYSLIFENVQPATVATPGAGE